jgi:hypothetical protein
MLCMYFWTTKFVNYLDERASNWTGVLFKANRVGDYPLLKKLANFIVEQYLMRFILVIRSNV